MGFFEYKSDDLILKYKKYIFDVRLIKIFLTVF